MEVETGLVKYGVLGVRTGKLTPREAKLFVKSKNRSNPPRAGKQTVVIASDAEWESIFVEAERLREDVVGDRMITRQREITRRFLIVVGGIIILVLIFVLPLSALFPAMTAVVPFCFVGLATDQSATCRKKLEEEFKILEKQYGSF